METQNESGAATAATYSMAELNSKQRQLDEISRYSFLRHKYQGPREEYSNTMFTGLVIGGSVILFSYQYFSTSLPFYLITAVVVAVMFYMWVHMQSLDATYANALDKLLAAYDPVDKAAYQALQNEIRDAGFMDVNLVVDWAHYEYNVIDLAKKAINPVMYDFLQKRV